MMGKDTTTAAITAPCQVNSTLIPIFKSSPPNRLFFPKMISRKNPTTVGGNTIGREKMPSISALPALKEMTSLAENRPKKNVNTVAHTATFREIHKGEKSISAPILPQRIRSFQISAWYDRSADMQGTLLPHLRVHSPSRFPPDRSPVYRSPREPHRRS